MAFDKIKIPDITYVVGDAGVVYDQIVKDYPDVKGMILYKDFKEAMDKEFAKQTAIKDYSTWLKTEGKNWFIKEFIDTNAFKKSDLATSSNWMLYGSIGLILIVGAVAAIYVVTKKNSVKNLGIVN